jgi:hypothetical protein
MKGLRLLIFIFLCFLTPLLKAQDTLVKRNGEKLLVKLLEVNPTELKYKRFDYQDGPVFTVSKSELSYIVYANGVRESYENWIPPVLPGITSIKEDLSITFSGKYYYYKEHRLEEPDMLMVLKKKNDPKLNLMVKKTNSLRFDQHLAGYGGLVIMGAGFFTITGIFSRLTGAPRARGRAGRAAAAQNVQTGGYIFLSGVACEGACLYFRYARIRHARLAAQQYNKLLIP